MSDSINKQIISDVYSNTDELKNQVVEITKTLDKLLERQKDFQKAGEQTTKLDVLYKSAINANNAYADRLKYAQQLKDTYPEQFKNFDKEQIANGKAKTAYTDLAKSILASAKAKAALNKMTEDYSSFGITQAAFNPKNLSFHPLV